MKRIFSFLLLVALVTPPASAGFLDRWKNKRNPDRGNMHCIGDGWISYVTPRGRVVPKPATSDVIEFIERRVLWPGDLYGFTEDRITGQIIAAKHMRPGELSSAAQASPCLPPVENVSTASGRAPSDALLPILIPSKCPGVGRTCRLLTELGMLADDDESTNRIDELLDRYCSD